MSSSIAWFSTWLRRTASSACVLRLSFHFLWLCKDTNFSIKSNEGNRSNRRLRVRVRVRFLWFYSELTPTDPWCNMLRDFTWREKYEEAMSDEHPQKTYFCDEFLRAVCFQIKCVKKFKMTDISVFFRDIERAKHYHALL